MSNKQALLDAAQRCLLERGYARTTARDIASTAGVSLAAIGYHFGSTHELLNQALMLALEGFSGRLTPPRQGGKPSTAFTRTWQSIYDEFDADPRVWQLTLEVAAQAPHVPDLRTAMVEAQTAARHDLAALFTTRGTPDDDAVGAVYQALLFGLLAQRLLDPDSSVTPRDLTAALTRIGHHLDPDQ
ncbi:MAG: TetR/AcrR family transcriptional regulator [Candidatus Nanopelagicales bacterium]